MDGTNGPENVTPAQPEAAPAAAPVQPRIPGGGEAGETSQSGLPNAEQQKPSSGGPLGFLKSLNPFK